jgi:hypothetical protein
MVILIDLLFLSFKKRAANIETMASEIFCLIEEEGTGSVKELAKKLEIPVTQLERVLTDLSGKNVLEYDPQTGKIRLPKWIVNLGKELENIKPATGAIVLPTNQKIEFQDVVIENFTNTDLELRIRLRTKRKEIAICTIG